jgi:hypothetical protein
VSGAHPNSHNEVYDLVARTQTVDVSDLSFTSKWARVSEIAMTVPSGVASMPILNVNHLSITLKLPLAFFQSVERLSGKDPPYSDTDPPTQLARTW